MLAAVVDSGTILHVIGYRPVGGQPGRLEASMVTLARETQGQFVPIYSAASYQAALDRLADRLTTELMVDYVVPAGSRPNDTRIGVRVPGARVRGLGVRPR
jgi:hypothetical protein